MDLRCIVFLPLFLGASIAEVAERSPHVHFLRGRVFTNATGPNATFTSTLLPYDQEFVRQQLYLSQASYCISDVNSWDCATCSSGVTLEAVVEHSGGRALVGYDSSSDSLFVAYRGSSDIQNWIDNLKFFKTAPYDDMPDVKVELGFYEWYTDLKADVDSALLYSQTKFGTSKVQITGHSAGGAVATLHAFDMARGESSTAGLSLQSVVTFGSPRTGNSDFSQAHDSLINQDVIPSWRVTHYDDLVPHVPEELMGYHHVNTEVYYNEASTTHKVCDESGEDSSCSNSCAPIHCTSVSDHLYYLNTTMGSDGC